MADTTAEDATQQVAEPAAARKADGKAAGPLLSPDFLSRLERLELASRRILTGRMKGERRSKRKGTSVEFADHRHYVVGDDLRHIDWNILVRLDRLFIKLFEEEEDLHLHVLVDTSLSMDFGDPTKLHYARQTAAALAFVGLINQDRVYVESFSDTLHDALPGQRGRTALWRVMDYLQKLQPSGGSDFAAVCKRFAIKHSGKGVVVLLSDMLDKNGYEAGLRYLVAKQMDVYVVQILSAEEVDPGIVGDLKLVDAEDDDFADVTVSAPLVKRYKATVNAYCNQLRDYCTRRGMTYVFTTNRQPFEKLVLSYLRERGLVKM